MTARQHNRRSYHRHARLRWMIVLGAGAFVLMAGALLAVQGRAWRRQLAADNLLQQSQQREQEQQWLEAADLLEEYLNLRPDAADQRVRLARLYVSGAQDAAQQEKAIDLLYRALGVCQSAERLALRKDLAGLLLTAERFSEAEAEASQILVAEPDNAAALRVRAIALLRQYQGGSLDYRVARSLPIIAWLDEARRANPADIELAELTAASLRDLELSAPGQPTVAQRESLADACLDELQQASPQDPLVYLARHRYCARYEVGDAATELQQALRYGPEHPQTLLAAANAAQRQAQRRAEQSEEPGEAQEEFAAAADLYRRAVANTQAAPEPAAYLGLGEALLAIGQRDEALAIWQQGLDKFPDAQADFNGKLADAYLTANQPELAEPCLKAIDERLTVNSGSDRALLILERDQCLRRGIWLMQTDKARPAIEQLQRVITLQEQLGGYNPQTTRAWQQLGHAYAALREWSDSAAAFDYACFEQPQRAKLWMLASQSHLKAKRFDLAVDRAEQGVKQNPSALAHLVLAKALLGQQSTLPPALRNRRAVERALAAARQRACDGSLPSGEPLESLADELSAAQQRLDAAPWGLSLWQLHHMSWPSLPAVHQLFSASDRKSIEPQLTAAAQKKLPFEAAMLLSRVQAMRGEYELAEEMLTYSGADSLAELGYIQRELAYHRLARGDITEAHGLLLDSIFQSPENQALLRLTAEVDIEEEHRIQAEEADKFLP